LARGDSQGEDDQRDESLARGSGRCEFLKRCEPRLAHPRLPSPSKPPGGSLDTYRAGVDAPCQTLAASFDANPLIPRAKPKQWRWRPSRASPNRQSTTNEIEPYVPRRADRSPMIGRLFSAWATETPNNSHGPRHLKIGSQFAVELADFRIFFPLSVSA
jgi:hypothetical protein